MDDATIRAALEQHPPPWAIQPCWVKDCWCAMIVDANDKGDDDLKTCVVQFGEVSPEIAALIVSAVNEKYASSG